MIRYNLVPVSFSSSSIPSPLVYKQIQPSEIPGVLLFTFDLAIELTERDDHGQGGRHSINNRASAATA
jgi:hypothetical protein